MTYWLGAERVKLLTSKSIGPFRRADRVPDGAVHAVDPATREALCGVTLRRIWEDLDWATSTFTRKCEACRRLASE